MVHDGYLMTLMQIKQRERCQCKFKNAVAEKKTLGAFEGKKRDTYCTAKAAIANMPPCQNTNMVTALVGGRAVNDSWI